MSLVLHAFTLAAMVIAKPTANSLVLHESREVAPVGWIHTGAASAFTRIDMRIALPSKDFAGLEKILYDVSTPGDVNYGQHLTADQVRCSMTVSPLASDQVHSR
jgi:tripeptidyl-peptidase-1